MITVKRILLVLIALPIALLTKTWVESSAYMRRAPEVDVTDLIPIGVRTQRLSFGRGIKIGGFRSAGIQTFALDEDLRDIISKLGLNYLNGLKAFQGGEDNYSLWMQSPMDVSKIQSAYPRNAKILTAFNEMCRNTAQRDRDDFCVSLDKALATSNVYFTYNQGNVVILDAMDFKLLIAYTGSSTD